MLGRAAGLAVQRLCYGIFGISTGKLLFHRLFFFASVVFSVFDGVFSLQDFVQVWGVAASARSSDSAAGMGWTACHRDLHGAPTADLWYSSGDILDYRIGESGCRRHPLFLVIWSLTFQNSRNFFQPFGNFNLLGTMGLAALTADAMGRFPHGIGKIIIIHACHGKLSGGKAFEVIVNGKNIGNGDALGAAVGAIAAGGAGNGDKLPDGIGSLLKQSLLLRIQRLKCIHIAGVIQHLRFVAHTAEYYHHIIQ